MLIKTTLLLAAGLTFAGCRGKSNTTEQNQNPGAAGAATAAPKLGAPDPNVPNPNGASAAAPMGPDTGAAAGVNTSLPPSSATSNGANTPATITGTARADKDETGPGAKAAGEAGSASAGPVGGAGGASSGPVGGAGSANGAGASAAGGATSHLKGDTGAGKAGNATPATSRPSSGSAADKTR